MVKKKKRNSLQRQLFIIGLLAIPIIQFCIFYIYVNFSSIIMAFRTMEKGEWVWSMKNFKDLFKEIKQEDSIFWISLKNTGLYFVQGFITSIITGFIISYFLYSGVPGAKVYRILLFLPGMISSVVIVQLFKMFIGLHGPIPWVVQQIKGLEYRPQLLEEPKFATKTLLAYNIWFGLAGNLVLYLGAFNRIPKDVLEYGKIDGVSWARELFQIILPLVWPTMITFITIQITGIFGASGPIFLFTQGNADTSTIAYWLWDKMYRAKGVSTSPQLNYASAIGLFFTLIALPIVFSVRWGLGKLQENIEY